MMKKLIKLSIFLFLLIILSVVYLSIFGINTDKFNEKIKAEILGINSKINLEMDSINILLNPINLSIKAKTLNPKIIVNNNELELNYIKTKIYLKSFKFSLI